MPNKVTTGLHEERSRYSFHSSKLRRARKLYAFLCAPSVKYNADYAIYCAARAIDAGLYAKGSRLDDVTFSMERHCYKRYAVGANGYRGDSWGAWCRLRSNSEHQRIWEKARAIQKRNYWGSPKLRLRL